MVDLPQSLPVENYKVETTEVGHSGINPEFAEAIKKGVLSVVENPEELEISQLKEKYPGIETHFGESFFKKVEGTNYYALWSKDGSKVYTFVSLEGKPIKVESLRTDSKIYEMGMAIAGYFEEDGLLYNHSERKEVPMGSKEYMEAWKDIRFHDDRSYLMAPMRLINPEINNSYDEFDYLVQKGSIRLKDFLEMDEVGVLDKLSDKEKREIFERLKLKVLDQVTDERFNNVLVWEPGEKIPKVSDDSFTMEELQSYEKYFVTVEDKEVYQRAIELMKMKEQKQKEKEQKIKMATEQTRNAISTQLIMQ